MLLNNAFYAQNVDWYNSAESESILIQNSYPKGGPYPGITTQHFNHSYLVFFSRIENKSDSAIKIDLTIKTDPIPIPNSPGTYMQLYLPQDEMTTDKINQFSYGLDSVPLNQYESDYKKKLDPGEHCYFYTVAFFYQDKDVEYQQRGGNRIKLILDREQVILEMEPQVEYLKIGTIK